MKIQTLGGCCQKSKANREAVVLAVNELKLDCVVENISDPNEIMNLGVMSTPGLVINGKVVSTGRCLNTKQAIDLLKKNL